MFARHKIFEKTNHRSIEKVSWDKNVCQTPYFEKTNHRFREKLWSDRNGHLSVAGMLRINILPKRCLLENT